MKKLFIILMILPAILLADGPGKFYKSMEIVFVGAQVADIASTWHAIGSGAGIEGNPIARAYVGSKPLTVAIKGLGSYAVLSLLRGMRKRSRPVATVCLVAMSVCFGYIAYKNARIR